MQQLPHLLEQRAAHQVPVGVVDGLEVIQIQEHQRQRVVEALRAPHLVIQLRAQVPRVVAAGVLVGDRQLLHPAEVARVLDGDRRVVRDGRERRQVILGERRIPRAVHQLHDAQHPPRAMQRHRQDGARAEGRGLIEARGERGIAAHVIHQPRPARGEHRAGDALARQELQRLEGLGALAHGDLEVELARCARPGA